MRDESEIASIPDSIQQYSESELVNIWDSGDLFAHHLWLESRLLFSTDGSSIIERIGKPAAYQDWEGDFRKFIEVFDFSVSELSSDPSSVFLRGLLYMSSRDLAMVYSHVAMGKPDFSKYAPFNIEIPFPLDLKSYNDLRNCRIASTRGGWPDCAPRGVDSQSLRRLTHWGSALKRWSFNHD